MKTITYDETKFQLLPISIDGNMLEAAANTELLANRNHGEPASISDLWDALRAAAPQPECVEQTEAFEKWADAALYIADVNGMSDDTVIPTWPTGRAGDEAMEQWPQLTVGAVREVVAVLSHAKQETSHDSE